tara:strand:- start:5249 stop:5503 length:255 start_codon:yes stop_codon:yes gene_type:complete
MKRKHRVNFEKFLKEKVAGLRERSARKLQEKLEYQKAQKEKTFAKLYEMSYNELREYAKEKKINIYRKTKEEIIEALIEQERLH